MRMGHRATQAKGRGLWLAIGLVLALPTTASAQLVPTLPTLPAVPDVSRPVERLSTEVVSPGALRDIVEARALRLRALTRRNPATIDVDEAGAAVVRGRITAISPSPAALARARSAGFRVVKEEAALDLTLVVFEAPAGLTTVQALARLRELDPAGAYDYDHLYSPAASDAPSRVGGGAATAPQLTASGPVGLVDTGVDARHRAFAGVKVQQRGFAPGGVKPAAHGTAVASLLVGRAAGRQDAARGSVWVADVYGSGPTGGSAEAVARALVWLAGERVGVINVSLVGPANGTLAAVIGALHRRGHLIVAPVGNDGPAAPPLYPASYAGVISVTGVDARRRLLPEAGRARHLDFAAPGAGVLAADPAGGFRAVRGTSFAAPIVARRRASRMSSPTPGASAAATAAVAREARDLGARGPDPLYGKGLVGDGFRLAGAATR